MPDAGASLLQYSAASVVGSSAAAVVETAIHDPGGLDLDATGALMALGGLTLLEGERGGGKEESQGGRGHLGAKGEHRPGVVHRSLRRVMALHCQEWCHRG